MVYPATRSVNAELRTGVNEGGDGYEGKDWGRNHPDIELPEHAGPCGPGCECVAQDA